jgi:hypothetical protein
MGKGLTCALFTRIGKVYGWGPTFAQRVKDQQGELVSGAWVVKVIWGGNRWCMICIGNEVGNMFLVVQERQMDD